MDSTYEDYRPAKLDLGVMHPDADDESSSLSSVEPMDVSYSTIFPREVFSAGLLSYVQLEAVTYACHEPENVLRDGSRAGFLVRDWLGAGPGKDHCRPHL